MMPGVGGERYTTSLGSFRKVKALALEMDLAGQVGFQKAE